MQQVLIMMLGHPGSGKSYFTRQLAPQIGAVRLNGDHMRVAMFKDLTNITRAENPKVFGALEYAVQEVLRAGHSVIYDVQHNYRADRERVTALAAEFEVPAVLIWIKTPYEVALQRGQERQEQPDQRRKSEQEMRESLEFFMNALEVPGADEPCIIIDGTVPFAEQQQSFIQQLAHIHGVS